MKRRYIISFVLVGFTGLMMVLFERFGSFFFPAYRNISKGFISFLSYLTSFSKIAIWDYLALLATIALVLTLLYTVIKRKNFFNYLSYVLIIFSILLVMAVDGWMLNHYAPPLSDDLGMTVAEYSKQQLYEATKFYLEKAEEYAASIPRDDGHAIRQDFYELARLAPNGYRKLEDRYPVFKGNDVPVKNVSLIGKEMLKNDIVGIFMPLSAEAGISIEDAVVPMCFDMCHELAHRLCIASEQEANFCAFLSCITNDDVRFIYSGYYKAYTYCFSALYKEDNELALSFNQKDSLVYIDRVDTNEHYSQYDSPTKEYVNQMNDDYLKLFSKESGVKSYGEVVDYLIAWYILQQ